jgi:hypothetical protein
VCVAAYAAERSATAKASKVDRTARAHSLKPR